MEKAARDGAVFVQTGSRKNGKKTDLLEQSPAAIPAVRVVTDENGQAAWAV